MKLTRHVSILLLAALATACESINAPEAERVETMMLVAPQASPLTAAAGTFVQHTITSVQVSQTGPNTHLQQTSAGSVSGTLSGSYTDDLRVVIHPHGRFNAQFTVRCECTVAGKQGFLELVASDRGELVSPSLATFAGRATITGGTGELSDLRGVLEIEGTIDLDSGLATYAYSGRIH